MWDRTVRCVRMENGFYAKINNIFNRLKISRFWAYNPEIEILLKAPPAGGLRKILWDKSVVCLIAPHVVRFGQIGNKGGFGDGGHGVLPCVLWVSAQKHRRCWRRAQCGCLRARHSDLPDKPIRAAISRSRPRAMALPSSLRALQ